MGDEDCDYDVAFVNFLFPLCIPPLLNTTPSVVYPPAKYLIFSITGYCHFYKHGEGRVVRSR